MTNNQRTKLLIAQEAARIIADEGIGDYLLAKRKAAIRLDLCRAQLPRNEEIEIALIQHHRLYHTESHPSHIRKLRKFAMAAMHLFRS